MSHANARFTPAGRLLMVQRIEAGMPQAHVARQMGLSRGTVAKPESTDGFVGSTVWGRVAAGLVRVCGPARFGACSTGVRGWCGWWRVGFGCAAPGAERRLR